MSGDTAATLSYASRSQARLGSSSEQMTAGSARILGLLFSDDVYRRPG